MDSDKLTKKITTEQAVDRAYYKNTCYLGHWISNFGMCVPHPNLKTTQLKQPRYKYSNQTLSISQSICNVTYLISTHQYKILKQTSWVVNLDKLRKQRKTLENKTT